MRGAVVGVSFPSTLLIVRVGSFVLLVPWVFVWAMAAMLLPVCWAACRGEPRSKHRLLRSWHVVVLFLISMRGTLISIRSHGTRVYLRWF